MIQCLNCKTSLKQHCKYCSVCGQSTLNLHQSFTKVAFQALHEMLDIDGRLATTLKILLFSPGRLSKEFVEGRRIRYTPPLRMYLVISLLFFVIVSFIQTTPNQQENIKVAFLLFPVGTLEQVPKLMFLMLPFYALLVKLFHRKSLYVFNLIFALHIHSLMYLMLMVILPLNHYDDMHLSLHWLQYPFIVYLFYYFLISLKVMYENSWLYTIWTYVVTFVLYMLSIGLGLEFIGYILN